MELVHLICRTTLYTSSLIPLDSAPSLILFCNSGYSIRSIFKSGSILCNNSLHKSGFCITFPNRKSFEISRLSQFVSAIFIFITSFSILYHASKVYSNNFPQKAGKSLPDMDTPTLEMELYRLSTPFLYPALRFTCIAGIFLVINMI